MFGSHLTEAEDKPKSLIIAYGSFSPPTSEHINFLKTMVASSKKNGDDVLLFLQPNEEFESSAATPQQEQAILRAIPGLETLNICLQEGIRDLYDALAYVYNELHFKSCILMCGSDQELKYQEMIKETNGRRTEKGYYSFEHIKVVSTGKPNPDKSEQAVKSRNDILNGDFKSFIKDANLPYISTFKNLFDLLRYGAEEKLGIS